MPSRILVKNIANSYSTGDVVAIYGGDHIFGRLESKARFIEAGNSSTDWPRQFVIVNVTDASPSDYLKLVESNESGRKYYIQPQGEDSPFYEQLLEHAEVTVTSEILNSLIVER